MESESAFDDFRLGIDEIDEQHRALFDYVENLDAAIASGDRWLVVYQTLAEIEHWAKIHFTVEETLMRICRYPHLGSHVTQHAALTEKVVQMKQEALTQDISRTASQFLHAWMLRHVGIEDRKYAEHFLSIGELFAPESHAILPNMRSPPAPAIPRRKAG